jgi:hypothetical protein
MAVYDNRVEVPAHLRTYRRFILAVRYVVCALIVAASFVAASFYIRGGNFVFGVIVAAIELAIGYYAIGHSRIHPHAPLIVK